MSSVGREHGSGERMLFITLCKWKVKRTKEMMARNTKQKHLWEKEGFKVLGWYWTLGQYDSVIIFDAKDEKAAMKLGIFASDTDSIETLVAVPREEAVKLLE